MHIFQMANSSKSFYFPPKNHVKNCVQLQNSSSPQHQQFRSSLYPPPKYWTNSRYVLLPFTVYLFNQFYLWSFPKHLSLASFLLKCPTRSLKIIILPFPVAGHSYVIPDRIFGTIERVKSTIVNPQKYYEIFNSVGTVFK